MKAYANPRSHWFSSIAMMAVLCMLGAASCKAMAQSSLGPKPDAYLENDRAPDARFKADILVVVAHPDDETLVTSYLAREIFDEHKSVAVVYGTRGDGGNNEVGPEQALAMGQIRESEARRALGTLGISNVWFLSGLDTPSQNVLNSLERWGHGSCLDQLVRLVRITRPSVILTFLPDFTTGENHADHQAAGVLATEAFDGAGDPVVFPEQVSPAANPEGTMNFTEALRPWQPEKIYYFHNPTHDIFTNQGPHYATDEMSPSRHEKYGMLAAKAFAQHRTQGGDHVQRALDEGTLGSAKDEISQLITEPVRLIFGKSLVPSTASDDVFAGVVAGGIPFQRVAVPATKTNVTPNISIGDPWNYYRNFWHAHGIDHLANVVSPEVTVKVGGSLVIPLIIENPLDDGMEVNVSVTAPPGWQVTPVAPVVAGPHAKFYVRVQAAAPAELVAGWQQFTVSARSRDRDLGKVEIRAELSTGWVAPQ